MLQESIARKEMVGGGPEVDQAAAGKICPSKLHPSNLLCDTQQKLGHVSTLKSKGPTRKALKKSTEHSWPAVWLRFGQSLIVYQQYVC